MAKSNLQMSGASLMYNRIILGLFFEFELK